MLLDLKTPNPCLIVNNLEMIVMIILN